MIRKHYKKLIALTLVIIAVLGVSAFRSVADMEGAAAPVTIVIEDSIPMVNATG